MNTPLIYVAGHYRAKSIDERDTNIAKARYVGENLLAMGFVPVVPHLLYRNWELDDRFDDSIFLNATMEVLYRCDALALVSNSIEDSLGTIKEVEMAKKLGLPIYFWEDMPLPCDVPIRAIFP